MNKRVSLTEEQIELILEALDMLRMDWQQDGEHPRESELVKIEAKLGIR